MNIWIIGILVLVILIIIGYYYNKNIDYFTSKINIDCVVARYNESVSWLFMKEFANVDRFFIYNKGKPITEKMPNNALEIMLPNVGKCDHTFLYHIINNYDDLADITLFVSGRADDPRKGPKIIKTMKLINKTHNSVFVGERFTIPDALWNFTIDKWLSSNPENHVDEGNISNIAPAKVRPFGKWFRQFWKTEKTNIFVVQSIFAVHRKHIIQHPKEYYEPLYEELNYDINPEAGHYMERSWGIIFSPYPRNCKYF